MSRYLEDCYGFEKVAQLFILLNVFQVETPTLFRRTPGGAAEFLVPCSSPNIVSSLNPLYRIQPICVSVIYLFLRLIVSLGNFQLFAKIEK